MLFLRLFSSLTLFFALTGCIGTPSPRATHQQRIKEADEAEQRRRAAYFTPEIVALRMQLIGEYKQVVESVYANYHGIYADMVGRVIYVRHPLFSGYEFSAGPLTPATLQWAATRREELAKADIIAAGIMSGSGISTLPLSPGGAIR